LDRVGHHGSFVFGRIQYEIDNALKRYERLSQDDDYTPVDEEEIERPSTKQGAGG